jgi:hypothetical protein
VVERPATVRTAAIQFDAVLFDHESRTPRQGLDEPLNLAIGEFHHAAAVVAEEVVGMLMGGLRVMAVAMIRMHDPEKAEAREEIEGSVHTRQADAGIDGADRTVQIGGLEVNRGLAEHLQHRAAGSRELETMMLQSLMQ